MTKTIVLVLIKTSCRRLLKTYELGEYIRLYQDVLKTSSRCLLKTKTKDVFKTSSKRLYRGKCWLGNLFRFKFWVRRFQISIIKLSIIRLSNRNEKNSTSCTFIKEYINAKIWNKFKFNFVHLRMLSQRTLGHSP